MQKMVVVTQANDEGSRQRIMETVATFPGLTSISMDQRDGKLTVIGESDLVRIFNKLKRRYRCASIASLGPHNPTTTTTTTTTNTTPTAENERARLEAAYREVLNRYPPMPHYSNAGEHIHYNGCTIS